METITTTPKSQNFDGLSKFFQDNATKFTAPFGILEGTGTSKKGKAYKTITFGFARTLDASINYYNRKFILVYSRGPLSRELQPKYESVESLITDLEKLI